MDRGAEEGQNTMDGLYKGRHEQERSVCVDADRKEWKKKHVMQTPHNVGQVRKMINTFWIIAKLKCLLTATILDILTLTYDPNEFNDIFVVKAFAFLCHRKFNMATYSRHIRFV